MAFKKVTWFDRDSEYPNRRRLINANGEGVPTSYTVERDEGLVYEEGTELDARTFNDLENRIAAADTAQSGALQSAVNTINGNISGVRGDMTAMSGRIDTVEQTADNALQRSGGVMRGSITMKGSTISPPIVFSSATGLAELFMGHDENAWMDLRTSGNGLLVRSNNGEDFKTIHAGEFVQVSSRRFKEDIDAISEEALERFWALEPVAFHTKADGKPHYGFIAEEVAKVDERLVEYEQEQVQGYDIAGIVGMIKACHGAKISELEKRLEAMEKLVKAQDEKIEALNKRIK